MGKEFGPRYAPKIATVDVAHCNLLPRVQQFGLNNCALATYC